MCNPAAAQFGFQAVSSIGSFAAQSRATNAANRARLLNFREDNKKYYRDVILNNVRWKNGLLDSEIAYANLFQQASESWRQQDLTVQQAEAQHADNTIKALSEIARKEYAGTQTCVTASRLANEGPRQVGFALTKSMRQLMMTKDSAALNKEIISFLIKGSLPNQSASTIQEAKKSNNKQKNNKRIIIWQQQQQQ